MSSPTGLPSQRSTSPVPGMYPHGSVGYKSTAPSAPSAPPAPPEVSMLNDADTPLPSAPSPRQESRRNSLFGGTDNAWGSSNSWEGSPGSPRSRRYVPVLGKEAPLPSLPNEGRPQPAPPRKAGPDPYQTYLQKTYINPKRNAAKLSLANRIKQAEKHLDPQDRFSQIAKLELDFLKEEQKFDWSFKALGITAIASFVFLALGSFFKSSRCWSAGKIGAEFTALGSIATFIYRHCYPNPITEEFKTRINSLNDEPGS